MNRRGFLAALFAAPAAVVAGLRERPRFRFDRIWALIDRYRIKGAHYEGVIWDDPVGPGPDPDKTREFMELSATSAGDSYNFVKSKEAGRIMARTATTKHWAETVNKATREAFSK